MKSSNSTAIYKTTLQLSIYKSRDPMKIQVTSSKYEYWIIIYIVSIYTKDNEIRDLERRGLRGLRAQVGIP